MGALRTYSREWYSYLVGDSKYQGLDLLRALAITMVMVWHFDGLGSARAGWIGVDLFFVLSGFLIGSILFKSFDRGTFKWNDYAWNRFLRIYPLYAVALAIFLLDEWLRGRVDLDTLFGMAVAHALFAQTLMYDMFGIDMRLYNVTWSLVVEVVFYATVPVLVWAFRKVRAVWLGLVLMVIGFTVLRYLISSRYMPDDHNWQFFSFMRPYYRYDELLVGVAVAWAVHSGIRKWAWQAAALGAAVIIAASMHIWAIPGADKMPSITLLTRDGILMPNVLSVGFALLVYGLLDKQWSCAPINALARLAYPLYLFHMITLHHAHDSFGVYIALSFVAALVASYAIEYPFIRLYKRPKRTDDPIGVGVLN